MLNVYVYNDDCMNKLFFKLDDIDALETRCRLFHLHKLIKNLTDEQKEAVKEIGFGGLLHLQLQKNPTKMLPWLVERFDASSRHLSFVMARCL